MADASADESASQPEPLTPPSTAAPLPVDTPAVFKGPPLTGQLAKSKYIESGAMPVYEMLDYVEHAKRVAAAVRRNLWHDIETWTCPDDPSITVKNALAAMPSKFSKSENPLYFPSVRLLNVISLAYYSLTHRDVPHVRPIVWHCNPSQIVLGDYLGVQQKPDTASGVGTLARLLQAARAEKIKDLARPDFPWTPTGSVGEAKTELDKLMAQLKAYVANDKRYRVDMATVHGFRLAKATARSRHAYDLMLASINACGFTRSPPIDARSIEGWLAHVVMVYDSHATRHPSLAFAATETTFTRWDVQLADSRVLAVAPFYVTPPPGRVTFASFEVDVVPALAANVPTLAQRFRNTDTLGFVKFSWQDEARTWKERDLLNHLHRNGWLPGLVRHYPSQLSHSAPAIRQLGLDDGTTRAFEMLHLGSIGEPLSQCKTVKQLLMTVYDVLETSANMFDDDVLHRDLSWFNLFTNPEHDPKLGAIMHPKKMRCIASILGEGDAPSALVADLDHSARFKELVARTSVARKEKTGTPMFRSVELSRPLGLGEVYNTYNISFGRLVSAFEVLESRYRDALLEAFPNDDFTFAKTFKGIAQREMDRRNAAADELGDDLDSPSQKYIVPDIPHALRHDAESMYWVLLWGLGRAHPLGHPDELTDCFNTFCEKMLWEGSPVPGRSYREHYLRPTSVEGLLHPRLKYLERFLLEYLATYFSIPWGLYEKEVGPRHAHIAMRRLLLLTLLRAEKVLLRLELNTEHPRRCNVFTSDTVKQSVPASTRAKTGDASLGTEDDAPRISSTSAGGAKRPHQDDDDDDDDGVDGDMPPPSAPTDAKRRAIAQPDPNDPATITAGPDDGAAAKTETPAFVDHYTEKDHLTSRSANSLLLKVWKDRQLWFGSGY